MKNRILILLMQVFITFPLFAQERGIAQSYQSDYIQLPRVWAVVVGIDEYKDENITDLKYSVADAEGFFQFLNEQQETKAFPELHIEFLKNENATYRNVKGKLSNFLRAARNQDMVFIFFAGHGRVDPDGEPYLLTHDTEIENLAGTAISMHEMSRILKKIESEKAILFVDACHSGGIGSEFRSGKIPDLYSDFYDKIENLSGKVVFASSRAGQLSQEDPKLGHGLFTYYLLEGLRGNADENNDDKIILNEISNYVFDKVRIATDHKQIPEIKGDANRELPLAIVGGNVRQIAGKLKKNIRLKSEEFNLLISQVENTKTDFNNISNKAKVVLDSLHSIISELARYEKVEELKNEIDNQASILNNLDSSNKKSDWESNNIKKLNKEVKSLKNELKESEKTRSELLEELETRNSSYSTQLKENYEGPSITNSITYSNWKKHSPKSPVLASLLSGLVTPPLGYMYGEGNLKSKEAKLSTLTTGLSALSFIFGVSNFDNGNDVLGSIGIFSFTGAFVINRIISTKSAYNATIRRNEGIGIRNIQPLHFFTSSRTGLVVLPEVSLYQGFFVGYGKKDWDAGIDFSFSFQEPEFIHLFAVYERMYKQVKLHYGAGMLFNHKKRPCDSDRSYCDDGYRYRESFNVGIRLGVSREFELFKVFVLRPNLNSNIGLIGQDALIPDGKIFGSASISFSGTIGLKF